LLDSEKRSLRRFLTIYLSSTFLLFLLATFLFYAFAKHHLLDQQIKSLEYQAAHLKSTLRVLHQSNDKILIYPKDKGFDSAIYDLDKRYIFGTIKNPLDEKKEGYLYFISKVEPYYLGAAYLLVRKKLDMQPIKNLQKNIFFFMIGAGIFFSILGYFLGRLFVAPMREAIENINHFIQDATHELNTPISTILTNIEMLETLKKCKNSTMELKRIEIASKTLSRIYDDLSYINLNHNYHREIRKINLSDIVRERLLYFDVMIKAKELTLESDIKDDVYLDMDQNDAIRVFDNLISNAIKYNKQKGKLYIKLDENSFIVEDSGIGINKNDIQKIVKRYKRVNKTEGGFGIGLDIVSHVMDVYGFELKIDSTEEKGTKVSILW